MTGDGRRRVAGMLRRARRSADLSQREMAEATHVAKSTLAAAEACTRDLPASALVRVVDVAGLRLALVDTDGAEVPPMDAGAVRDMGRRYFPAHLDTRYSDEGWWHGPERYSRPEPWYTFDRCRNARDAVRRRDGTPEDHHLPGPGDAPDERRAARRRAAQQRFAEGPRPPVPAATSAESCARGRSQDGIAPCRILSLANDPAGVGISSPLPRRPASSAWPSGWPAWRSPSWR
jgi:transcriptional regulator with XRE-family HTH domain